jgi:predicted MFS family arabinose efflux permease
MPFAILAAAFFLLGVMSTAILTHQVPMLIDRGMTSGKAAGAQVVYGVTLTFGRLFVGAALDRFFAPRVLMTSLCGVVLGLLGYASGASGAAAFVCAALVGFGVGAEVDALGYIVARYFDRGAYGRIYALVLACFTLGGGIGAAALGAIRTAHGTYTPGLWLIAAATTLAIAVLSRLQRSSETRELSQIARAQTV